MSKRHTSSFHVVSGALIFTAALGVSACADGSRSPVAPTTAGSQGGPAVLGGFPPGSEDG